MNKGKQPAFPRDNKWNLDGTPCQNGAPGMTMRQYYKAKAINAILLPSGDGSQYGPSVEDCKKAAEWAGRVADAMLAEDAEHEKAGQK